MLQRAEIKSVVCWFSPDMQHALTSNFIYVFK